MALILDGTNTPTLGGVGYGDGSELAFTGAGTSGQVLTSAGGAGGAGGLAAGGGGGGAATNGSTSGAGGAAGAGRVRVYSW